MANLKQQRAKSIHTRSISLTTYEADNHCIIVEGILKDNRLIDVFILSGEAKSPGVIHHMAVRLLVGPPGLTIHDIEIETPVTPRPTCGEIIKAYERIKGISIQQGFTAKVKGMMGGKNGCAHLTTLLVAMGPEAVQGYYAHYAQTPPEAIDNRLKIALAGQMKNTCHVWREDGPAYQELVQRVSEAVE